MKKVIALILGFSMVIGLGTVSAMAADSSHLDGCSNSKVKFDTDVSVEDPLKDFVPPSMDFLAEQTISRSTTIRVNVTEPCDAQWRNLYPSNWMWQAHRRVINADEILANFGIQYYSVSQKYWTSNNTTPSALVAEARDEWGLQDGADLMVAFTGRSGGNTMGIVTGIGHPYALIFHNGYEYDRETVQHETGHCYGLTHCYGSNCVMTAVGMGYINTLCSAHNTQWNNARTWY